MLCCLRRVFDILKRFVYALDYISVEVVERLADLRYADNVAPLSVTYDAGSSSSAESLEGVAVERDLEVAVLLEVASERMSVESDLETLVLDASEVTLRSCEN